MQLNNNESDVFSHALIPVDRAIGDLRRGATVLVKQGSDMMLMLATEGAGDESLVALAEKAAGEVTLAITGQRARVLGLASATQPVYLVRAPQGLGAMDIESLADPTAAVCVPDTTRLSFLEANRLVSACLTLTKLARLLPAAVVVPVDSAPDGVLSVEAHDIESYQTHAARSLRIVSQARVPLDDAEQARLVAFRPSDGGIEHFAIIVGEPDLSEPVLARLHSECFTGDLLGSMRCDCGSQLRGAIAAMAKAGSGVLLYLAQEGRGIGLVNKLRAYQLQDAGYDTIDANLQLGFDEDERVYLPAAQMLDLLGIKRVILMTNNPVKVAALSKHGIEVAERVRHVFATNQHNEAYLQTKASKAGHLI